MMKFFLLVTFASVPFYNSFCSQVGLFCRASETQNGNEAPLAVKRARTIGQTIQSVPTVQNGVNVSVENVDPTIWIALELTRGDGKLYQITRSPTDELTIMPYNRDGVVTAVGQVTYELISPDRTIEISCETK